MGASEDTGARARTWTLRESVVVEASPEEVFAALGDMRRMPQWSPECVGVWMLRERPGTLPSFIGLNRNGARRWFTYCKVITADPPREFAFRVSAAGLPIAIWAFSVRPARTTGTGAPAARVTQHWYDLRRGRRGRVADLLGRVAAGTSPTARVRTNRSGMALTLRRLKAAVEAAAAPASGEE
ncbi:SRPBCC family protein [Streptomyces sp. NPDC001046]|uniref:SRPBCC family protein n=1 Tax=Streptomyces sp. NPDC001046 TaxID=3364543 RepID=UPI00368A0AA4